MVQDILDSMAAEIARIHRRWAAVLRHESAASELSCRWMVSSNTLCWIVAVEEALEPDIDVELTGEVLVVRALAEALSDVERTTARSGAAPVDSWRSPEPVVMAILPVPSGYDGLRAVIRFEEGILEIRLPGRERRR